MALSEAQLKKLLEQAVADLLDFQDDLDDLRNGVNCALPNLRDFIQRIFPFSEHDWDEDEAFEEFMEYVEEERQAKPVPPPDYKALYEELRHVAVTAAEMPGRDWLAGQLSLCDVLVQQDKVLGKTKLVEGYL
jgi:hypothetical protein